MFPANHARELSRIVFHFSSSLLLLLVGIANPSQIAVAGVMPTAGRVAHSSPVLA